MGSLGETLRQARLNRGASIADAERETHIRRKYLEALESEDYAALPAQVYTRGFIRNYARFLGLDPEQMLDLFGPARSREDRPALRAATPRLSTGRPLSMRIFIALAVLLLFGLLVTYLWTQYNSFVESLGEADRGATPKTTTTAAAGRAAVASPSPLAIIVPAGPPTPAASPAPTPERGIVVEARVSDRTWMEVWVDGAPQLQSTLQAGSVRTFTATQQLRMRVGNAGGVQVIVNGEPLGQLGDRYQVKEFVWTR